MDRAEASLFFRLVTYRYGRGAILITTNKSVHGVVHAVQNARRSGSQGADDGDLEKKAWARLDHSF